MTDILRAISSKGVIMTQLKRRAGLAGEIRPVSKIDQRISEAEKLGYKTFVVSKYNKIASKNQHIKLILVGKIEEAFATLFA